ncbi:hypothetical protein [Cellulosimicrobium cellulans]|uniref:hypothetical protein n=1 Tax=Cellulosimicrobium cellulans TaxID=1710 RepID=UPI0037C0CAC5
MNGISKTSGSVPPASWGANVVAFHSYSSGTMSMSGFAVSNSSTWALKASIASCSEPGRRETTLRVTFPSPSEPLLSSSLPEPPLEHAASVLIASAPARVKAIA